MLWKSFVSMGRCSRPAVCAVGCLAASVQWLQLLSSLAAGGVTSSEPCTPASLAQQGRGGHHCSHPIAWNQPHNPAVRSSGHLALAEDIGKFCLCLPHCVKEEWHLREELGVEMQIRKFAEREVIEQISKATHRQKLSSQSS